MNVLVFTHHYPSKRLPTMAPYSLHTYRALARHASLKIVAPTAWWARARTAPRELLDTPRERHTGIEALFPTYWSIPGAPRLHARAIHASLRRVMGQIDREFPWDVMLAAWAYPDTVAAARFAEGARRPLVTTVLGSDINDSPKHPALRPQIAAALRRCQRVVAVSAALGDRVAELGVPRERIVVLHNAVDGERFAIRDRRAPRVKLGIPADAPVVLYAGYHVPEKGVDVLVEAMARLGAELGRPDVHLVTVGGGELLEPLRARASALGLRGRVRLLGWALPSEIADYMAACDVFCLPSRREGCPNVVLEALASGRPVVATDVGGVPELVRPEAGNGVLVPAGDAPALAAALKQALERPWDPAALRASVGALSWNVIGDRYRDLLEEVVSEWRDGAGNTR